MVMKLESHEHFRCFTQICHYKPWLVNSNYLPVLKELLTVFVTNHLITKNKQFKSIYKKMHKNGSFGVIMIIHYVYQLYQIKFNALVCNLDVFYWEKMSKTMFFCFSKALKFVSCFF